MIIHINDDFSPDRIAESGQCFRWEKTDPQTYRIPCKNDCLYLSSLGDGRFELDCTEEEYLSVWHAYFDLRESYRDIRLRVDPDEDPFLYRACEHEKGMRILRQDPWEILISFIISQNKNIPAIRRSVNLLAETCGEQMVDRRGRPFYAFPGPEAVAALSEDELKHCSLGYRCKYVHEAARTVAEGRLLLSELVKMDDPSAIRALTELYGVGIKVANCITLFGLHHLDAFPKDVWVKRILKNEYPAGYPFSRYSPYNGIYQQYMFAYYREQKAPPSSSA